MSDDTNDQNLDDTNDTTANSSAPANDDATIDFGDEFGMVKFADDDDSAPAISLSENQTDQLPHWTEPPTGELPKFVQPTEDTISPTPSAGDPRPRLNLTGSTRRIEPSAPPKPVSRPPREGRISIGSDPTGERNRPDSSGGLSRRDTTGGAVRESSRGADPSRPQQVRRARPGDRSDSGTRPRGGSSRSMGRSSSGSRPQGSGARDLPTATAVGVLLGAVFIAAVLVGPVAVMLLLVVVLGLAAVEFFNQTTATGYQPALIVGVAGCVSAPLAAYWIGDAALPLVIVFAFIAGAISFIGTSSVESGPVPNLALTMLGLTWIGLFGSYGALILRLSNSGPGFENVGTDTLFILVVGIIANDTAAYFVGAATGRTPLRAWISPSKTMEGFVGGAIGTFVAVILVGLQSGTWTKLSEWLLIALVISILGPIGDLTESMFKRNMDIKDFGTVLRGHGGALDRFDSVLFALPIIYYLTLVLTPWAS